jgi:hypothetical protein
MIPIGPYVCEDYNSAFAGSGISMIAVGEGNANLAFCGDFLMNLTATPVNRYFGNHTETRFDNAIESLSTHCSISTQTQLSLLSHLNIHI